MTLRLNLHRKKTSCMRNIYSRYYLHETTRDGNMSNILVMGAGGILCCELWSCISEEKQYCARGTCARDNIPAGGQTRPPTVKIDVAGKFHSLRQRSLTKWLYASVLNVYRSRGCLYSRGSVGTFLMPAEMNTRDNSGNSELCPGGPGALTESLVHAE